jgi:uncharacterized protein YndB with AHSA1/START domain
MTTQAHHSHFTLVRDLPSTPARVWGAFARQDLKRRWFGANDQLEIVRHDFDFRPGGEERMVGKWKSGMTSDFRCHYYDIVDGERITYAYEMVVSDWKMSVSLATIEVEAHGDGARLTITEQGVFYGGDGEKHAAGREKGTSDLLDGLAKSLAD